MDLNNLSVFDMTTKNMSYLTERQKVLATNVANVNTPGYVSQDLEKPSFSAELKASTARLSVTNPKHFAALPSQTSGQFRLTTPKPTTALTLDGNGVVLEEQLNEIGKNSSEHNRMLTIYNKYKSMIKLAHTEING